MVKRIDSEPGQEPQAELKRTCVIGLWKKDHWLQENGLEDRGLAEQ